MFPPWIYCDKIYNARTFKNSSSHINPPKFSLNRSLAHQLGELQDKSQNISCTEHQSPKLKTGYPHETQNRKPVSMN